MNKIKIDEEHFEKYEEDFQFDNLEFDTKQEIEVRIPFVGYYSLKVNCKNPQIAMGEVLKANKLIGIMSIEGSSMEVEDIDENETYSIVCEK